MASEKEDAYCTRCGERLSNGPDMFRATETRCNCEEPLFERIKWLTWQQADKLRERLSDYQNRKARKKTLKLTARGLVTRVLAAYGVSTPPHSRTSSKRQSECENMRTALYGPSEGRYDALDKILAYSETDGPLLDGCLWCKAQLTKLRAIRRTAPETWHLQLKAIRTEREYACECKDDYIKSESDAHRRWLNSIPWGDE